MVKSSSERREEIAMRIYPVCIETVNQVLMSGRSCGEKNPAIAAAKMAVRYSNELLHQLAEYERIKFTPEAENF